MLEENKVYPSDSADNHSSSDEDYDDDDDGYYDRTTQYCSQKFTSEENLDSSLLKGENLDSPTQEYEIDDSSIELKSSRRRALLEFRRRVEDAITGKNKGRFGGYNNNADQNLEDITLWGVPLLPSKGREETNVVLMKFLKSKDFRVSEALNMLRRTLKWRKEFDIDGIFEEKFRPGLENLVYVDGVDKQGRPLCYNIFGAFKDKELYKDTFGTREKRQEFMRWRIQSIEKGIRKLCFKPGGVYSIVQIMDFKNSYGQATKELRSLNRKLGMLFEENYPDITSKIIFINVPFWYFVSHALQSHLISHRTKNNIVIAKPSRVTQTLLKYIAPENIPVQYGGLKRENENDFSAEDEVLSLDIRGGTVRSLQIPVAETGVTVFWDVTVVGYEVTYKEEFIPDDDCSYNVLIRDKKRMRESARNSFYISEPGKIVITIVNVTAKRKKIFYRHKNKITLPVYLSK